MTVEIPAEDAAVLATILRTQAVEGLDEDTQAAMATRLMPSYVPATFRERLLDVQRAPFLTPEQRIDAMRDLIHDLVLAFPADPAAFRATVLAAFPAVMTPAEEAAAAAAPPAEL